MKILPLIANALGTTGPVKPIPFGAPTPPVNKLSQKTKRRRARQLQNVKR